MDELLYSRQRAIGLKIPAAVTIAGVGGAGAMIAIGCAASGVGTLFLFDPDELEEHNRARMLFCQGSIGKPKVEVVKDFIMAIRPDAIVIAVKEKLEGILLDIQLSICSHFIECTDSPNSQALIYNACKRVGATFIRAGYDVNHITGASHVSGWIKGNEEAHYAQDPSWIAPPFVLAGMTLFKLMINNNQEFSLDLSEIGIPVLGKKGKITSRCTRKG